ncbi:hypothetical protein ACP70R_023034 [Stipagrostis hirtigluma subsp. patula]
MASHRLHGAPDDRTGRRSRALRSTIASRDDVTAELRRGSNRRPRLPIERSAGTRSTMIRILRRRTQIRRLPERRATARRH